MTRIIGTSWKMNLTSSEAGTYFDVLVPLVADLTDREIFVLPPFPAIWMARERLEGTGVSWGAQHVHPAERGAHTGDVSAPMLADLGCRYVEVGHSERRSAYGEDDEFVAAQVSAIQRCGMTAIVCVGERDPSSIDAAMRELEPQLRCLESADPNALIIAYEPVWAIGVGAASADPEWISAVHAEIRRVLRDIGAPDVPIIYGGSVAESTAPRILSQPRVDGVFVGRSALDPRRFARIARTTLATAPSRPPSERSRLEA